VIVDEHEVRIYSGTTPLKPADDIGSITVDRGWSPHVQGRISVLTPSASSLTSEGSIITIELTQRFGDFALTRDLTAAYAGDLTSDLTSVFASGTTADLTAIMTAQSWVSPPRAGSGRTFRLIVTGRIRTRTVHTLEVESEEAVLDSLVWYDVDGSLEGLPLNFTANTARGYLDAILTAHQTEGDLYPTSTGAGWTPNFVDRSSPTPLFESSHVIEVGEATFATMKPLLIGTRQRLFCPGDGTAILTDYPYTLSPSITVIAGDNLVDFEVTTSGLPLNMLYRFQGSESNPAARPIHTPYAFPELNYPHGGLIEMPVPGPVIGAGLSNFTTIQAELAVALRNPVGLESSPLRLVAVNNYDAMPGSPISYTTTIGGTPINEVVDAVTWRLGGQFEMDIWI